MTIKDFKEYLNRFDDTDELCFAMKDMVPYEDDEKMAEVRELGFQDIGVNNDGYVTVGLM